MLQDPNDPIRRAAESCEGTLKALLLKVWAEGFTKPEAIKACLTQAWRLGFQCTAGDIRKDLVSFEFSRQSPLEIAAAEGFAAQFVRELQDDQQATIKALTVDAMRRGLGPPALAQRVQDSIGLTAAQGTAISNYRAALQANSAKALQYRLRDQRFDPTTDKAISAGTPLSAVQIDTRVQRYRERYLAYRATTIARYETLFASNAGAYAAAQGSPNSVKTWMLARDERVCPRCRSIIELQPEGVALNATFQWQHHGKSGTILHPPLHPDCRCTISFGVR